MDSILSVPLLSPSLKRQGLYEVSIGLGKETYEDENGWLNDGDRDFGIICHVFSPSLN